MLQLINIKQNDVIVLEEAQTQKTAKKRRACHNN
jgi:hypothetical protein